MSPITILRLPAVMARTGLSRSSVYALEAKGELPARVKLSSRCVGWVQSEIDQWLEARSKAA